MCLAVGLAARDYAIIATDEHILGPEGPDGEPTSSRELFGGKMRQGRDGWMTVCGGSYCRHLLDDYVAPLMFSDLDATRGWISSVDLAHEKVPGEPESWVTTVFAEGERFYVRAYDAQGNVHLAPRDLAAGETFLAAIFPQGVEDKDLQQRLRAAFLDEVGNAVRMGHASGLAIAARNLFSRTREYTAFLGPTVDVVVMGRDEGGRLVSSRFKHATEGMRLATG